jgi:hypothetical protein
MMPAEESRSGTIARAAFFHIDARFSEELLARLPKPLVLIGSFSGASNGLGLARVMRPRLRG